MTLAAVWEVLFPPSCIFCRRCGEGVCAACAPSAALVHDQVNGLPVSAAGPYAGALRTALLAVKAGRRDVAHSLGRLLARYVPVQLPLVPVPTTARRRRVRGFDQALVIAQAYEGVRPTGIVAALAQHGSRPQFGRSRTERLGRQARFFVLDPALVENRELLLIDDVVTTGATLAECASVLRACGARVAGAIALARTLPGG